MGKAAENLAWDSTRLADPHAQPDKALRVQAMFDAIAPTYERVNRLLSAGQDAYWRRRAVELAAVAANDRVLDLACGTGDFARAFARARPAGVIGADFSAKMVELAAARADSTGRLPVPQQQRIDWCRADALSLPFADGSFNIVSCAFGVRNFQNLSRGLNEMARVLSPGGRLVILEFSMPRSRLLGRAYLTYFRKVLPKLATWLSGDHTGAYDYLPQSVSTFVDQRGMMEQLSAVGLNRLQAHPLSIGIVTIYLGHKP